MLRQAPHTEMNLPSMAQATAAMAKCSAAEGSTVVLLPLGAVTLAGAGAATGWLEDEPSLMAAGAVAGVGAAAGSGAAAAEGSGSGLVVAGVSAAGVVVAFAVVLVAAEEGVVGVAVVLVCVHAPANVATHQSRMLDAYC